MIAAVLGRQPALFLFLSFIIPLLEPRLTIPLVILLTLLLKELKGRGVILIGSVALGWSSALSIEQAERTWENISKAKGFIEIQGTWHRDVYTSNTYPYEGWATVIPLSNQSPTPSLSRKVRAKLLTDGPLAKEEAKMAGHQWQGRMLMRGESPSPFVNLSYGSPIPPSPWIQLRNILIKRLEKNWSHLQGEKALPLLRALITGDRLGLEAQQKLPFSRLGLLALLAISGLHLGLIFLSVKWILGSWVPAKAAWVALLIAMIYATLGGWSIALIRAFGMCSLAVIAKNFLRKYKGWNALFFMAWLELTLHPRHLNSPSFLLTYGGVFGILWSSNLIKRFLPALPQGQKLTFGRRILETYLFSWGAMLFTWPITGLFFNSIPTWAWLLAPPFFLTFSFVMAWVFMCLILSLIFPLNSIMLMPLEAYLNLLHIFSETGAWVAFKIPGHAAWTIPYYLGLILFMKKCSLQDKSNLSA